MTKLRLNLNEEIFINEHGNETSVCGWSFDGKDVDFCLTGKHASISAVLTRLEAEALIRALQRGLNETK